MNKEEFLLEIENCIKALPKKERGDILQDYEEHFSFGLEEGKTEEDIVQALGSPKQLAKEILAEYHIEKMETSQSTGNTFRAIWAVIGLGFFNLVIVLGPLLGLVGLLFGGWVTGATFIVTPFMVLVNAVFNPGTFEWFDLFISFMLTGIGFFVSLGMYHLTIWGKNLLIRYLKYNVALVKGGD